ncbi:cupin domain-containing protein [Actinokineospora enzanensis]|uniref:cupin domain-containing protein n=1 Tax=Actinokineospora enzanensis TaxID=155975 RepID=UPI00035F0774|nr:cupin domain-containing protein [Actinokineospora enzanensis]
MTFTEPTTYTEPTTCPEPTSPPGQSEVLLVRAGEGIALWVPEEPPVDLVDGAGPQMSTYTFVATGDNTRGSLAVVDTVVPAHNGPPPHQHADADESFYVLEGRFDVWAGGKHFTIGPGDFVFVPRGTEHIWKNAGDTTARMIRIYTPGGMERFFIDIGRPAQLGEPAPQLTVADVRRAEKVAAEHYGG